MRQEDVFCPGRSSYSRISDYVSSQTRGDGIGESDVDRIERAIAGRDLQSERSELKEFIGRICAEGYDTAGQAPADPSSVKACFRLASFALKEYYQSSLDRCLTRPRSAGGKMPHEQNSDLSDTQLYEHRKYPVGPDLPDLATDIHAKLCKLAAQSSARLLDGGFRDEALALMDSVSQVERIRGRLLDIHFEAHYL